MFAQPDCETAHVARMETGIVRKCVVCRFVDQVRYSNREKTGSSVFLPKLVSQPSCVGRPPSTNVVVVRFSVSEFE